MKLVFMATPDFAVPALAALVAAGHEILCVYTQPPRPAGRGQAARMSPVAGFAAERGIPVRHPVSLKDPAEQAGFAALDAELAVVVAYGLILPQAILGAPRFGCVNIHASLLPRWRGAAPIQRAIEAGDPATGISIMRMEAGLDTGPVLLCRETPIGTTETAGQLHDRLAMLGADAIVEALDRLPDLHSLPQNHADAVYAAKITKAEARLDFTAPASALERKIRALSPFPGAYVEVGGERIKWLLAEIHDQQGPPGTILDRHFTIACGKAALRPLILQRAGKSPLAADAFLRGFAPPVGENIADAAL